jgi:glycerol-3-phosphate dehydrogenase
MTGSHAMPAAGEDGAPADILVVGGGVNGTGIARDAAGRGFSVTLCEQGDLGGATSSASTKLIHGGLRYLEHYEFRLVRESLAEREVLLRAAPHIIWPLRFVLPHERSMRPAWLLRLGLFLYDHLGGREMLPPSRRIDLRDHPAGRPLDRRFTRAFEYSDCWVEDSRLVVLNAMDAAERGATVLTRTRCVSARREGGLWVVLLSAGKDGEQGGMEVRARSLVNAAGPWVAELLDRHLGVGTPRLGVGTPRRIRLVKGSHIVVPKLFEGEHAYIFQNDDRRIVFAIPYERDFTLIGTTDIDHEGPPGAAKAGADEIAYLCRAVSAYFARLVSPADVVWTYSGVRPLHGDEEGSASAVTRDYVFDLDAPDGEAPLLSVFGGKITTYRRLSEEAVDRLSEPLGRRGGPWTAQTPLPGGDMPGADFGRFVALLAERHPWLPIGLARRYARAYGTRIPILLNGAKALDDLGPDLGGGVHEAELCYAVAHEFARTAEDFLWRRSKLGLHLDRAGREAVTAWFGSAAPGAAIPDREAGAATARSSPARSSMGGMR